MTYTFHGYHIPGSPEEVFLPPMRVCCGGCQKCQRCAKEAIMFEVFAPEAQPVKFPKKIIPANIILGTE